MQKGKRIERRRDLVLREHVTEYLLRLASGESPENILKDMGEYVSPVLMVLLRERIKGAA